MQQVPPGSRTVEIYYFRTRRSRLPQGAKDGFGAGPAMRQPRLEVEAAGSDPRVIVAGRQRLRPVIGRYRGLVSDTESEFHSVAQIEAAHHNPRREIDLIEAVALTAAIIGPVDLKLWPEQLADMILKSNIC